MIIINNYQFMWKSQWTHYLSEKGKESKYAVWHLPLHLQRVFDNLKNQVNETK